MIRKLKNKKGIYLYYNVVKEVRETLNES